MRSTCARTSSSRPSTAPSSSRPRAPARRVLDGDACAAPRGEQPQSSERELCELRVDMGRTGEHVEQRIDRLLRLRAVDRMRRRDTKPHEHEQRVDGDVDRIAPRFFPQAGCRLALERSVVSRIARRYALARRLRLRRTSPGPSTLAFGRRPRRATSRREPGPAPSEAPLRCRPCYVPRSPAQPP